ncbi:MAG: hypothetical protein ACI8RD_007710, partial [Bacillariaceae sp.]
VIAYILDISYYLRDFRIAPVAANTCTVGYLQAVASQIATSRTLQ